MNLGFFKDLKNSFKEIEISKLIQELENYLNNKNEELGILEKVQNENNVSIISENKMRNNQNEILQNYADKTIETDTMYFVSSKSKIDDEYIVFKYENGKASTIRLNSETMPLGAGVNSVLKEKNGKYILDKEGTSYVKDEIMKMAKEILKEQKEKLEEYRIEGHLYVVEEDINERIFLKDLNSRRNYVIEEVEFPKELKKEAIEGTVFKYENGKYNFYSRDGFERIYK